MTVSSSPPITVLTSGIGLGIYIPALLVEKQLQQAGVVAETEVLESYYTCEALSRQLAHRRAYRENFALAQMAHRMARGVEPSLDRVRLHVLLDAWRREERVDFILWSGFWLPVIEQYRALAPHLRINLDLCRIDAVVSASFKVHRELERDGAEIWLWRAADKTLVHRIPVTSDPPVPFAARDNRVVVHGGGWSIGTYPQTVEPIRRAGYKFDIVVHDPAERDRFGAEDRCYMLDPDWDPWRRDAAGRHTFPPMGVVEENGRITYRTSDRFHEFHRAIRTAKAVVSKPGGCTLIDSLAAATPVILLESYGYAEQANADVWAHLAFGIPYAAWKAEGFSGAAVERAHASLAAWPRGSIGYPQHYAARRQSGGAPG